LGTQLLASFSFLSGLPLRAPSSRQRSPPATFRGHVGFFFAPPFLLAQLKTLPLFPPSPPFRVFLSGEFSFRTSPPPPTVSFFSSPLRWQKKCLHSKIGFFPFFPREKSPSPPGKDLCGHSLFPDPPNTPPLSPGGLNMFSFPPSSTPSCL